MVTFQNSNEFLLDEIEKRDKTVSTLLIPEDLMKDFLKLKGKCRNDLALYLRILLRRYRTITHSGLIPEPIKVKTEYQEEELGLKRQNFRPMNVPPSLHVFATNAFAWFELGELALVFGKSRCWLFVYLLKLDIMGLWHLLRKTRLNFVVPTVPSLEIQGWWTLQRVLGSFARSYYVKV